MDAYEQAFQQIGDKLQQQGAGLYHRFAVEEIPQQAQTSEQKFRFYMRNLIEKFQEHADYSHNEIVEDFNELFGGGEIEQLVDGVNERPFDGHTIKESLIVKHLVGTYRDFFDDGYFDEIALEDNRTPLERIADREGGLPVGSKQWPVRELVAAGVGVAALGCAAYLWFSD